MWKPESFNYEVELAGATRISSDEYRQMIEHVEQCTSCYSAHAEFLSFIEQLSDGEYDRIKDEILNHIEKGGLKERFIERARATGIQISHNLANRSQPKSTPLHTYRWVAAAALAVAITGAVSQSFLHWSSRPPLETRPQALAQIPPVSQGNDNSKLQAMLSELRASTNASQKEIASLRDENSRMLSQIATLSKDLTGRRAETQALEQSLAHLRDVSAEQAIQNESNAQLLGRTQTELDNTRAHAKGLEEENGTQKAEIATLSQQISVKMATIASEREFLAEGRDITDLMGARNLHIIDVRDADGKGKNQKSFGRIFYTEGKSLIFYAYDLDEGKVTKANYSFEVWGERLGEPTSVRNLGILYTDDKEQKRWALTVDDPQQLAEIDSLFVTLEPRQGTSKPLGGKILFAFLGGKANHP